MLRNDSYIIPLMFTMYTNAMLRENQEKYDMATLLLYRLLEMIEQRRLAAYGFVPLRKICESDAGNDLPRYGKWFSNPEFFGELNVSYQFPFKATLAGYLNYSTVPGDKWNVGISFGIYILPTKFMR